MGKFHTKMFEACMLMKQLIIIVLMHKEKWDNELGTKMHFCGCCSIQYYDMGMN